MQEAAASAAAKPHQFEIASLNLANARRDEYAPNGLLGPNRFGLRQPNIMRKFNLTHQNQQFLCVSELRECYAADGRSKLHPVEILCRLASTMNFHVAICQPADARRTSFWKAIIYNHSNYICLDASSITRAPTDLHPNGNNVLIAQFEDIGTKKRFWIVNVHYPCDDQIAYSEWLAVAVRDYVADNTQLNPGTIDPVIMIGDMNTFFDKDGYAQLDVLSTAGWQFAANDIPTFKSFPQDSFQGESVLDHAAVLTTIRAKLSLKVEKVDHSISDHALVVLDVTI